MDSGRDVASESLVSLFGRRAEQSPAPAAPRCSEDTLTVFLSDSEVRLLLAGRNGHCELPPLLQHLPPGLRQLRVVADYRSFAPFCSIGSFTQRLQASLPGARNGAVALQVFVLGNDVAELPRLAADEGELQPALDHLVAAIGELIFEARRRADDHFGRAPLTLPDEAEGAIHLLPAGAVAEFLASRAHALPPGAHLLYAMPVCSRRALVRAVAEAAQIATRDATGAMPVDAVGELLQLELNHACHHHQLGRDAELAARSDADVQLHAIGARDSVDWQQRTQAIVQAQLAAHRALQLPVFTRLPGLQWRQAGDDQVPYLRCGHADQALLLVNAFGLTLDVWHDLARRLSSQFRVLVIDEAVAAHDQRSLSPTYYDDADALPRYLAAVRAVLQAEGLAACHVAGWCSGAKYAIELARSMPESVASLSLFAPSFAGAQEPEGADSAFETNLHTMCKLVERMPQAAANMASSLMAMTAKAGGAAPAPREDPLGAAVYALADRQTLPWQQAPFSSSGHMVAYSRQLLNFRAHQISLPPAAARLEPPVLLVTGQMDTTTCNRRAQAICARLCSPLHFELQRAGHYFIQQNSALISRLLDAFVRHGMHTESPHPRLARVAQSPEEMLVSGEL
ncbi:MAG: alpha/beta fold hydrolase [Rhizobacter sp.]